MEVDFCRQARGGRPDLYVLTRIGAAKIETSCEQRKSGCCGNWRHFSSVSLHDTGPLVSTRTRVRMVGATNSGRRMLRKYFCNPMQATPSNISSWGEVPRVSG